MEVLAVILRTTAAVQGRTGTNRDQHGGGGVTPTEPTGGRGAKISKRNGSQDHAPKITRARSKLGVLGELWAGGPVRIMPAGARATPQNGADNTPFSP